ncbi:FAD-dependent oxidoreductase [Trinickia mobilis]|uniref:FAD-dependent oxidoreductase n=1 Tax=Trinickia mobilis TaxID=2816356 RepID=UPI001A904D9D|nr:FAD-dependent oxidoreductase [Trinickia mobilis]
MDKTLSNNVKYDPASVAGKQPPVADETDLLIVGAGSAGIAAALSAAGKGLRVTLVDENPVPIETMGAEIPLHFGGRMGAVVANRNAVFETMLDTASELGEALEVGVDVRLGTAVWGLFPQRATAAWIDGCVAGLADDDRTYLLRFRQVIVASGQRDMGLAFDGWERPGVMGASAAYRLATTYGALDSKTAVLVGSGTASLQIGNALADKGVKIAAVVEQGSAIKGDETLLARLESQGARVFTGHVVRQAVGDAYGVKAVVLTSIDSCGKHIPQTEQRIECDTVLLGIASIPAIELLEAVGCATAFQAERGGHVALVDANQRTSLPFVFAAGDCAGTWGRKSSSSEVAKREGRIAAAAALQAFGVESSIEEPVVPDSFQGDAGQDRCAWVRASVVEAQGEPYVCQCEEVTAAEILEVRPPRYLEWEPRDEKVHTRGIAGLACDGPPNPDIVKRLTRASMGPCQGRRCREQVAALLSIESGTPLPQVPLATFRAPVRPLALKQLATLEEAPGTAEHWDSWFHIASQWVPFWQSTPPYTAAGRQQRGPVASE